MNILTLEKNIVKDKTNGLSDQKIGDKYKVNLKFIERAITKETGTNISIPQKSYKISRLEPKEFNLENTTVWSFRSRGNWATHNGNYRGNWSPYIPRNVICKYSKENDTVLDYFCGAGTTAVECKLLNRNFIGIDINPNAIELAKQNLFFDYSSTSNIELKIGDARNLNFIKDKSIDLICSHPPYSNILRYTHDNNDDLSNYDVDDFLIHIEKVARESYRILEDNKYCAILIGDMRKNKNVIPLGFWTIEKYLKAGFKLKELIIKRQHNCKTTGFWYTNSIKFNFLLLAHEYLAVFEKINKVEKSVVKNNSLNQITFIQNNEIQQESTTIWIFEKGNWIDNTLNNLIKRYSKGNFLIYNNNNNNKANGLIIYFNDKNFMNFNNDINNYLENGGIFAVVCEDFRMNNNLINSNPINIEKYFKRNECYQIKEIIVVQIKDEKIMRSINGNLNINHKYILIYKKVK